MKTLDKKAWGFDMLYSEMKELDKKKDWLNPNESIDTEKAR